MHLTLHLVYLSAGVVAYDFGSEHEGRDKEMMA